MKGRTDSPIFAYYEAMHCFGTSGSGFPAILRDLRVFFADIQFDRPVLLWLTLIPVALSILAFIAMRREHRRFARLGNSAMIAGMIVAKHRSSRLSTLARSFAWIGLALGLAGPRWGAGDSDGVAVGRDLVLMIDLSRSMLADDMEGGRSRFQAAQLAGMALLDDLKTRGGHRVSIVLFAARPLLLVPLTTDYDHAQAKLRELNGRYPPAAIRPDRDDVPSGTRIGAAIAFAIESLDARYVENRDLILLSDGDDPANDREWTRGIAEARKVDRPVHVIGLGDPNVASLIPLGNGLVEFAEPNGIPDPVRSKLQEERLLAIAQETRGQYLPSHRSPPDLARFVRTVVDHLPSRELADDPRPQKQSRATWFYGFAVLCLLVWWGWER